MRLRREALGISQGRLGRYLGLTFSQVQKYEKGSNRIGAGRLYQIAQFLGVQPGHFFEGIGAAGHEGQEPQVSGGRGPRRDEVDTLTESFAAITDPHTRASVLALVRSLTAESRRGRIAR